MNTSLRTRAHLSAHGALAVIVLSGCAAVGLASQHVMDARFLMLGVVLLGLFLSRFGVIMPLAEMAERVEEQRRRLQEQVDERQRVNAEMDELAALRDEFLMTINHQLRTPLTAIVTGAELLCDEVAGSVSQEHRMVVQSMSENAARLSHLVEEALDLSLLTSGRRPLQRERADLTNLLCSSQAKTQASAPEWDIRLLCGELPFVYMDTQAVREVLNHLLRNALRHAPPRSVVAITAVVRDQWVETAVRDQGPGLSPEQLERLFQPFVHLHTPEAPGSQGGGLGLAFCRQVIERHRGTIRAESKEGSGTTITFTLPIVSATFLFEEACRSAQEDAEYEGGRYGLVLVHPAAGGPARSEDTALMQRAEAVLRKNTHHNDRFVQVDDLTLALLAVSDRGGIEAMTRRLQGVLDRSQLGVRFASALFPDDADRPDRLLAIARGRLSDQRSTKLQTTMAAQEGRIHER